jgi:type IV pilus assembly protein PilE
MRRATKGFTLIELMIVVAVVGILAAIAYPSYMNYVRKSHRAEVAQLLVEAAQNLERYYSRAGKYTDDSTISPGYNAPKSNAWYDVVAVRQDQTFTITATPANNTMMANDVCGKFIIDQTGARTNDGKSGSVTDAFCWGR